MERSVSVRLQADVGSYIRGLQDATHVTKQLGASIDNASSLASQKAREMEQAHQRQLAGAEQLGKGLLVVGAGIAAGLGLATRAAVQWESAWAGVAKTVDGSEAELAQLEGDLRDLATTLPATHQEIAAVAEAAGQLGVATGDIASFTETMIALGESTNLTADEAATAIAQLMNVMGTAPADVGRLGSALVELGNNGASTERQIIMMAQRIAGAGAVVGASEADVLALANALASAGIEVEAGGSAISKVMVDIASAAAEGGDKIEAFAAVAGESAEEFAAHFREDPVGAINTFIQGLGRMNDAGQNVFGTLENLGLSEIRTRDALLRLAASGDLLTQSLEDGERAWGENLALTEEAERRYGTTEAQLQIARNQLNDFAITMGEVFLPTVAAGAEALGSLAGGLGSLPEPALAMIGILGAAGAAVALTGGSALIAMTRIAAYREALTSLTDAGGKLGRTAGVIDRGMRGTAVWAGRATVALGALVAIGQIAGAVFGEDFAPQMEALAEGLARFGREGRVAGETADVLGGDLETLGEAFRVLGPEGIGPSIGNSIKSFIERPLGLVDTGIGRLEGSMTHLTGVLSATDAALAGLVSGGRIEEAAGAYAQLAALAEENGVSHERLVELMPQYTAALEAAGAAGADAGAASEETGGQVAEMGLEAAIAAEQVDALREAFENLFDIQMGIDRATIAYHEGLAALREELTEGAVTLDVHTQAGRDNQSAILDQVEAISDLREANIDNGMAIEDANAKYQSQLGDLEDLLIQLGYDEEAVRDLIGAYEEIPDTIDTAVGAPGLPETRAEVGEHVEGLAQIPEEERTIVDTPGLTSAASDVNRYTDDLHDIPERETTRITVPGIGGLINRVNSFADAVRGIPTSRNVNINTHFTTTGQPSQLPSGGNSLANRWGGVYHAQQGLLRHAAVFPPSSPARFAFAEPATGGEAFIPRLGDRQRSLSILDTAAGWYDARVVAGGDGGSIGHGVALGRSQRASGGMAPVVNVQVIAQPGSAASEQLMNAIVTGLQHRVRRDGGGDVQAMLGSQRLGV